MSAPLILRFFYILIWTSLRLRLLPLHIQPLSSQSMGQTSSSHTHSNTVRPLSLSSQLQPSQVKPPPPINSTRRRNTRLLQSHLRSIRHPRSPPRICLVKTRHRCRSNSNSPDEHILLRKPLQDFCRLALQAYPVLLASLNALVLVRLR